MKHSLIIPSLSVALAITFGCSARAASATWVASPTDANWTTGANWGGSAPGGSGTASADVATFNTAVGTFGGSVNPIVIDLNRNVAELVFTGAAGNYVIGSTGGNQLTLTNGGSGNNWIALSGSLTSTNAIETVNAPLRLEGTGVFINNSANGTGAGAGTLNIGGAVTEAVSGTLTLSGNNTNANTVSGAMGGGAGTLTLIKAGPGNWVLSGANTYTGSTTISAGTLTVSGANGSLGGTSSIIVASGATFVVDDRGTASANANRLNDTAGITMGAGTLFQYFGSNQASTNSTETLGPLTFTSGAATVTIAYGGTNSAVLTTSSGSFTRSAGSGGLALINGANLGKDGTSTSSVARLIFNSAPTVVGSTAAVSTGINSSSKSTQVVVGLLGEATATTGGLGTATGTANTFLTYNAATGLRPLNLTDEFTNNAVTAGNNTYINAATTAASTASINSLIINGGDLAINNGATVTDASGMLLFAGSNAIKPTATTGALAFGSNEAIIAANAGVTGTISAVMTGTGGVTTYGPGTVDLAGANTSALSGTLNISSTSTVSVGNNNAFGSMTIQNNGGTIQSDNQARTITNSYVVVGTPTTIGGSNDLTFAGNGSTPAVIIGSTAASGRAAYVNNTGTTTISGILSLNNASTGAAGESIKTSNSANLVITGAIQDNNSGNASGGGFTLVMAGVGGNITVNPTSGSGNTFLGPVSINSNSYNTLTLGGVTPLSTGTITFNTAVANTFYFQALTNNYTLANPLAGGGSGGAFGFTGANNLILSGNYNDGSLAGNGQITNLGTGTLTLSGTVTLSTALTILGSGNTVLSGTLASGTQTLTSVGSGSLALSATNNLSGASSFTGGTVVLDYSGSNANRLGQVASSASALTLSGVNLQLKGGSNAQALGTSSGTTLGIGQTTITQTGGGSSTIALGGITRAANSGAVIDFGTGVASTTTTNSAGIIGGYATVNGADWAVANTGSPITALGSGSYSTLTNGVLSAAGNYYFTGSTPLTTNASTQTVNTLKLDATGTLTLGSTLIINTGGLLFTGSGNETITGSTIKTTGSNSQDLIVNQYGAGVLTIASAIANTNGVTGLTKTGAGTLVLTSASNSYSGGNYLDQGILSVGADANLGGAGTVLSFNGGTLETTSGFSSTRTVTLNANGGTFQVDTGTLTLSGAITSGSNYGGFTKTGAGTLLLSAANGYAGPTTINNGTLKVGNATALGSSAATNVRSTSPVTVNTNGTLDIAGFTVNIGNLTLAGGTISDSSGTGSLSAYTYNMQSGSVGAVLADTGNGAAVNANNPNTSTATALNKTTSGTVTLTGANTYSGATIISGGTLQIGNGGSTGTLGSANVTDNATLAFKRSNAYTVANAISGSGAVTQIGSGTTTLTNTNSYTGGTTISGGALSIVGSTASTGLVSVGGVSGGLSTANLIGTGTIGGAVTTSSANSNVGHIAPGVSGAGTLTVGGALTIGTGTALDFDLNTATTIGGGVNDLIAMTGTGSNGVLTIGSTLTINLNALGTLTTGSTSSNFYTLISGAASNSGLSSATYLTSVTGSSFTAHVFASGNNLDVYFTSVSGTTYTLGTTAVATLLHQGATTSLTTTVTNTGTGSADTLNYTNLGASSSLGNGTGSVSGGGPVANNNGTATNSQTYTATNAGTDTISSTGSGTNATAGGSATLTGSTGTTITVYTGQSTWAANGSGSWGTLAGTGSEAFGANWGTNQGSPGLDSGYQGVDKATFGAQTASSATVNLNAAAPNLNSITFSSPSTSYTVAQGSGSSSITLSGTTPSINVTGNATAGSQTISAPVILGANTSVNVGSKQTLNLNGVISGSGKSATYTGPGTTITTADNSYTGGTTISGGVLYVNNGGGASYSAPITNPHAVITATNSTGSGTGTGSVTVQSGATLAGSGTIKSTSGGITVQNGGTLSSGAIQSGTSAGQGLTINNAAGLSSALVINGGSTLTFALGSTTAYNGGSGALNYANPNTNSTYLSLTGSTADLIFSNTSVANKINLVDLTTGSSAVSLTLRSQNPYLLIQTALGDNSDFANLWTTGGQGQNGLVLGVSDGTASGYTAFNITAYDITGNVLSSSSNLENLQLYLYNGDLEVVPEPGTWALMLGGLLLLIVVQRRRRSQNGMLK